MFIAIQLNMPQGIQAKHWGETKFHRHLIFGLPKLKAVYNRTLLTDKVVKRLITEGCVIKLGIYSRKKKRNHKSKITLIETFSFMELNQKRCVKLRPTAPFKKADVMKTSTVLFLSTHQLQGIIGLYTLEQGFWNMRHSARKAWRQ